jgi:imidazolonepropionase-like amidohydrolase
MEKSQRLRIDNAIVFDGEDIDLQHRRSILIDKGCIIEIGPVADASNDDDVLDAAGMTVMPGLIDAHFHCNSPSLNVAATDRMPASHLAQYARRYMEESLLRGFTTLRDAGGADSGLKAALAEGLIAGPRLYTSGLALSQTGGHGDIRDVGVPSCGCAGYSGSLSRVVDGVEDMRRAVRDELRRGADQIKLFVSGGVLSPTDPIWMEQFTDDEIRTAVEEAERWRTYVMAHALTSHAVRRCAQLGVRSIEHGLQMDRETADIVAASSSYVVITLLIVTSLAQGRLTLPPGALEKAKRVAEQAVQAVEHGQDAGVRMGFGTDLLGELHGSELEELTIRASVSGDLRTLRAATSVNAEIMGLKGEIGCVRPGARADLLIVDGDPTTDVSLLTQSQQALKTIVKGGQIVKNDTVPQQRG